MRIVVKKIQAA